MEGGNHNGRDDAPIGAILENARRERGLSLSQVEDATKIRKRYLDGLEREDFSVLPDAVYVQGFLKTYANYLGLDGDGLAREFRDRRAPRRERQLDHQRYWRSDFEKPLVNPGGLADAERRRVSAATILTVALALLVLALVIGLLYLIGSRSANTPEENPGARAERAEQPAAEVPASARQEEEQVQAPAPEEEESREQATPAEEPQAEDVPAEEEPAAETINVVVSVPEVPVGITVRADGEVVADVYAQPGFTQTFEARDAVVVEAANAGAVAVEVDGEDRGYLGYYGQPITQTFSREPAE